jgi:hypothetical protein
MPHAPETETDVINDHAPAPVYVPDDWEDVVEVTRSLVENESTNRFQLGWLAEAVEQKFSVKRGRSKVTDALPVLADQAGIGIQTLKKYRWVGATFDPTVVARFVPPLTFSYFQVVTRVARKGNMGEILELLEQCAADIDSWPVRRLDELVNERQDRPKVFTVMGEPVVIPTPLGTVIGVIVEGDAPQWEIALSDHNLAGIPNHMTLKPKA